MSRISDINRKVPFKSRPSMIGRIVWNKGIKTGYNKKQADKLRGRPMSEERKKHLSEILKGRKKESPSRETRDKIRKSLTGRVVPIEVREKMSKNSSRYWLGKKMSLELRKKLSLSHLGKKQSPETIAKKIAYRTGKKHSIESRLKIGASKLGKKVPLLQGANHYLWKGGISRGYRKGYKGDFKYTQWRASVFSRDNWTCQTCGARGYVEPHHVKGWAKFPEHRYDVENGVTLCKSCHKLTYNYKGKALGD
jgi:hypothetical protein